MEVQMKTLNDIPRVFPGGKKNPSAFARDARHGSSIHG